ncbi:MAG: hypothetical protein ACF788_01355 [Novipirellula sp. JB048]
MYPTPSFIAGADISPSKFVKIKANNDNTAIQCGAGDVAIGVSAPGTRSAPIPGADGLAAADGETCLVYGLGETCEVTAGGAIQAGDTLKPDADADAVPAAAGEAYSAVARSGAADGEKCKCVIVRGTNPA